MRDLVIEAKALSRRFGQLVALDSVSLTVKRGETVALFGANGAGKTTLLRLLGLGLTPHSGELSIDGNPSKGANATLRGEIGWLAHASLVYDDLSPLQNLTFWGELHGVQQPHQRAVNLLQRFSLERFSDEPTRTLSRGLRQRLSLARALVHEPTILLLDEPFTGLDPKAVRHLIDLFLQQRDQRRTTLLSTHRVTEGIELSDRWLLLHRGRLIAEGLSDASSTRRVEQLLMNPGASA